MLRFFVSFVRSAIVEAEVFNLVSFEANVYHIPISVNLEESIGCSLGIRFFSGRCGYFILQLTAFAYRALFKSILLNKILVDSSDLTFGKLLFLQYLIIIFHFSHHFSIGFILLFGFFDELIYALTLFFLIVIPILLGSKILKNIKIALSIIYHIIKSRLGATAGEKKNKQNYNKNYAAGNSADDYGLLVLFFGHGIAIAFCAFESRSKAYRLSGSSRLAH